MSKTEQIESNIDIIRIENHYVLNAKKIINLSSVKLNDLMIPDTYCSQIGQGYQCPVGMQCMHINLNRQDRGFNGFDEIGNLI